MQIKRILLLSIDEKLGPTFLVAVPSEFPYKEDFSNLARLMMKVGAGDEQPKRQLGGPIATPWENEQGTADDQLETKLLYFPISLPKPDSSDPRFRKHGQLHSLFIEFETDIAREVLTSYNDIEAVVEKFFRIHQDQKKVLSNIKALKGDIDQILQKRSILKLLNAVRDEDEAFELIGVATETGLEIAQTPDPPPPYAKAGFVSTLNSLSRKFVHDVLNQAKINHYINYKHNIVTVGIKFSNLILYTYINREFADLKGLENYLARLNDLTSDIRKLKSIPSRQSLLETVQTYLPNSKEVFITSSEGLPIVYESEDENREIDDLKQIRLIGTLQALINILFLESDFLKVESSEQIHFIRTKDNELAIIGALSEKKALAIITPYDEKLKMGEYLIKTRTILKKTKEYYK